ncbi:efflux RND transporter periplasmic adaptor subunit [Cyanobium gracile UHCC 0139]|uniref:Efflux RND transporter periplasmic adaptor subunit n=1 Tax=Cyanobium gracile UHCC 0139 TaxID=3110308 RepID=A0ABU5RYH9_9CYAN|nr:efflux RND transporter periplasmic adaptor subunit [Cyanobium gracile]MEA5392705.1 efflux RND transporter periplasmic adaptor subunit [Cyanobium gracile UHCC 0139]
MRGYEPGPVRWQAFSSLLPLAWLLAACGSAAPEARAPLVVQTVTVGEFRFTPGIETISTIESTSNVVMRPETDGRVVRILAREGQQVKAGQPILVLDNVQESAALDSDRAEAIKDRVNAERYVFLNEQGAVSTKDRDFYITQAIQSRDQARSSAATLGYKFVTAPIDGQIGNLDTVKLGDYVRQGQAITGIVNNSSLWTLMDVPATQSSQVKIGQPVQVESQGNPPVRGVGRVVFVSPYFSNATQSSGQPNTVLVKAEFPNLTGVLKTGQYVRNRIITGSSDQLAVPVEAVMMQAQQPFVYRVLPLSTVLPQIKASDQLLPAQKQKLEKLPGTTPVVVQTAVKLGKLQNNAYPVLSGLSKGDEVVVSNTALLRSGMPVRRAPAPAPAPAPAAS